MGEHHSHHHHHRRHSDEHSSRRRKLKRFWKKHKFTVINISAAVIAVVIVACCLLVYGNREMTPLQQMSGAPSQAKAEGTSGSICIEVPLYQSELYLVDDAVREYLNENNVAPVSNIVKQHREEEALVQDRGLPVVLSYEVDGLPSGYSVRTANAEVSENRDLSKAKIYSFSGDSNRVAVNHLKTGTKYYYRINIELSDQSVTSVQGSFTTADTPRMLSIDGVVNVRDIGGWKTESGKTIRQGLLYRGGELDGAVEPTYKISNSGINDMLTVLGISTDMDLRAEEENTFGIDALGANVEHIYYDVRPYTSAFVPEGEKAVCAVFKDLAEETLYPVYLHCTYGMDRTGTICWLLEALLGVSEEDMLRDYELSAFRHGSVLTNRLNEFIDVIQTYDGQNLQEKTESYLLSVGVTQQELNTIRQIFLAD